VGVTWLAVLLALASALTVGLSTSVQHRAAGEAPATITGGAGLLAHLASRPVWWFGQLLGFVALVFHALALGFGPIALVQPIAIMGMVFAPPIRAAMSHRRLPRQEARAVVLTFVGLVVFLLATAPRESDVTSGPGTFTMIGALALASVGLLTVARRVADLTVRAFLLGCAAGLLFGSVAVSLKIATHELSDHGVAAFLASPATYAFVALGVAGLAINQLSYRCARLSASMPALNIVNVLVALLFGYVVFEEVPRHTPLALVVELAAAALIGWGLLRLARFEEDEIAAEDAATVTRTA
jgi:drug/metabolite transporter (DMT)-like permease